MAMSKASTGDIILQGGRKVDLRDRSLSSLDVASLAKLISTSTIVEALSLYNVRLSSDVSPRVQQEQQLSLWASLRRAGILLRDRG